MVELPDSESQATDLLSAGHSGNSLLLCSLRIL